MAGALNEMKGWAWVVLLVGAVTLPGLTALGASVLSGIGELRVSWLAAIAIVIVAWVVWVVAVIIWEALASRAIPWRWVKEVLELVVQVAGLALIGSVVVTPPGVLLFVVAGLIVTLVWYWLVSKLPSAKRQDSEGQS